MGQNAQSRNLYYGAAGGIPRNAPFLDQVSIADLHIPKREVRRHPASQIAKIRASIEQFGFMGVVIIDAENEVVVGIARVLAAKQAGFDQLPAIRVHHLTKAQLKAYRIADNRIAEDATWDLGEMKLEFEAILELDPEFELEIAGFHSAEIDLVMEGDIDASDPADGFDATPSSVAVSHPGDIWLLGSHRLLCGDAKSPESYTALLSDESVDQIVSDLPYNVRIANNVSGLGKVKHREFVEASGEKSPEQFLEFLQAAITAMQDPLRPGGLLYLFMDWRSSRW